VENVDYLPAGGAVTGMTGEQASTAIGDLGWRLVLGRLCTSVRAGSLAEAAKLAARIVAVAGAGADGHLALDVRRDRVLIYTSTAGRPSEVDLDIVRRISELGLRFSPELDTDAPRALQVLEIGIDAIDIPAVLPFWRAVLGYAGDDGELLDPYGQGPTIWFQQMDAPRPQRNRIHFDVSVPHDEAPRRIRAALDAGGTLLSDAEAPAFWVLADVEGNEACVTTWQGRD
jgi:4a-hydroxytetrahydrobiopterin dehydratase